MQAWRGVEALELYLEAHEHLYSGRVNIAMRYAQSLAKYDDILGELKEELGSG